MRGGVAAAALYLLTGLAPLVGPTASEPGLRSSRLKSQQRMIADRSSVDRPNFVVILADDLGYGDVCAYGCRGGRTPHLDGLAANGIRFTSGYVSAPLCSPTRAGLLTGRYQQRFGHEFGAGSMQRVEEEGLGLPLGEPLLPQLLKAKGYVSGLVGKWHLGSQPRFHPLARGFDEFFGFLHGANLYMDPADAPGVRTVPAESVAGGIGPHELRHRPAINPVLRGREPVEEREYLTDALTREAVRFIGRHKAEPFFLYVAYSAPHTPLQVTDEYYRRFAHVDDERRRVYAAMVSALDDGVGALVAKLEESGLAERTLVLFLSDNGCATYVEACSNDPLLGGKLFHFEGGVRVPFIASWPGRVPAGRVLDTPVSSLDVVPTLLDLTAVAPPRTLDGTSLLHLLQGGGGISERPFFWRNADNFAVRRGRWKLVSLEGGEHTFLFDLSSGGREEEDLASSHPDVVESLLERYRAWEREMREPLWTPVNQGRLELFLPWLGRKETFRVWV